jgi:hypothetical protein
MGRGLKGYGCWQRNNSEQALTIEKMILMCGKKSQKILFAKKGTDCL